MPSPPGHSTSARASSARAGREPLEVDAAVDHRRLGRRLGDRSLEPIAEPGRDGDHVRRPANDVAGYSTNGGVLDGIRHVLAVRGDDKRGLGRQGGGEPRGHEEVRVDDVRVEASGRTTCVAEELHVAAAPSDSPVHDGALELVAAREELVLERGDEHAEIGVVGARIHL